MFTKSRSPLFAPPRMKARLTREAHKEIAATGKAPIYLRLTYGLGTGSGQRAYVATGVYLLAKEWDQKSQAVIGREEAHDDARSALKVWVGDAEKLAQLHRKTPGMTVHKYKDLLLGKEERPMTLLAVADAFYQNKSRPEMGKAFGTLRLYKARRLALETYLTNLKNLALPVSSVDKAWLRHFERWCVGHHGYAVSTTHKYVGFVQELVDFATHEKWLTVNPVEKYRFEVATSATDPTYLPEADVQTLVAATDLPRPLERARQAWLFCCYTGLSHIDYWNFDAARQLLTDASGQRWIRAERQKTGAKVSIPVLPETAALLAACQYQIPKLERSYFNVRAKALSKLLNLSLPLTTGLARHTASHRLRNVYGFTSDEAAGILGHSKQIQHRNYSRMREEGLTLALQRLGNAPTPLTLLEQLEAALADPCAAPGLREQLAKLVGPPLLMPKLHS